MKPCKIWLRAKDRDGYGFCKFKRRQWRAHRLVWHLDRGPIPDGMMVLHKCDRPSCVEIEHLFLGTAADNMTDKVQKGRQARGPQMHANRDTTRGERVAQARLTAAQVKDIRAAFGNGETQVSLATKYGVRQTNISEIVRRKTWKHVA